MSKLFTRYNEPVLRNKANSVGKHRGNRKAKWYKSESFLSGFDCRKRDSELPSILRRAIWLLKSQG